MFQKFVPIFSSLKFHWSLKIQFVKLKYVIYYSFNIEYLICLPLCFLTFSKWWGIECTSSQSVSKKHFSRRSVVTLSWSSVLGAGSLYVVLSTIIQMVSRGFTSREFASPSPFAIKFANPSGAHVRRLFLFKAFKTFVGHISSYCCARNFYIVKLIFLRFCLVESLRIYLQLFR